MLRVRFAISAVVLVVGCGLKRTPDIDTSVMLADARKGFTTKLAKHVAARKPVPPPPLNPRLFNVVKYDSPAGQLSAYLSPNPGDGMKYPAIIWITGGDCNTIGDVWTRADPKNDQAARQYRKSGIMMMYPSLRGGNDNPGNQEAFYGEVDDVIAAAEYLATLDYIDTNRIYLGGHSTGGTLALLVSEMSDRFRAVFAFGPVDTIANYPSEVIGPVTLSDSKEVELRSPGRWLHSIKKPTFVFEGTVDGNLAALEAMSRTSTNPKVHFFPVKGANHFSLLAPMNQLIANKILKDEGEESNITFTEAEVNQVGGK